MDDLLVYIAKELVSNPDEVNVKKTERGNTVIFELSVAPEDTGKIIGKNGRIANAIRTLVQASSSLHDNKHVKINIDKF